MKPQAMTVKFKRLSERAKAPTKAYTAAAGYDLYAARCDYEGGLWVCHSDVAFEIPEGHVGLLFPRSSICKTTHMMVNSVGVIDADYRGEVSAKFTDGWGGSHRYHEGDRFAQLVIIPIPTVTLVEADALTDTERGTGGYGSTGR